MRTDRLAIGTLCNYLDIDGDPSCVRQVIAMVIGTWAYTGNQGTPGTVETRSRRFRADPQTDESAHGYLLLPSQGTGFIYAHFGDVATGDLIPLT